MKAIYTTLIALLCLGFVSCEDKGEGQKLDPNAKLAINAPAGAKGYIDDGDYATARQVIEHTTDIVFENFEEYPNEEYLNWGIGDEQRDYENMRIIMWGENVVRLGTINISLIEGENVILVTREEEDRTSPLYGKITDTLAYVPNIQIRTAEPLIKAAYAAEEYDKMYELFQNSLTFIPINGAEWLKLKAAGNN